MRGLRRFLIAVMVCGGCAASARDPSRLLETWRHVDTCRDLLFDGGAAVPADAGAAGGGG